MKQFLIATAALFCIHTAVTAQEGADKVAAYKKTITERAARIVVKLNITDSVKFKKITTIVAQQYFDLNDIYNRRDAAVKALKDAAGTGSKPDAAAMQAVETTTTTSTDSLHKIYIATLSRQLTEEQVTTIKDGMTYGVLPLTYGAYLDMIPTLTEPQKKQIMEWLVEAREHSMDAESSEKKHAWFGKYKGRINNYLSKEGYDIKKEEAGWQQRIKEKKEQKTAG